MNKRRKLRILPLQFTHYNCSKHSYRGAQGGFFNIHAKKIVGMGNLCLLMHIKQSFLIRLVHFHITFNVKRLQY